MSTPAPRASDRDRETVADRLRTAAAEGRLEPDELEERLSAAYGARTIDELAPLTADLPAAPAPPAGRPPFHRSPYVRERLATFITVNVICIAIWLATGANGSFWPVWVLIFSGVGLFATSVKAALGVDQDDTPPARERRDLRR